MNKPLNDIKHIIGEHHETLSLSEEFKLISHEEHETFCSSRTMEGETNYYWVGKTTLLRHETRTEGSNIMQLQGKQAIHYEHIWTVPFKLTMYDYARKQNYMVGFFTTHLPFGLRLNWRVVLYKGSRGQVEYTIMTYKHEWKTYLLGGWASN